MEASTVGGQLGWEMVIPMPAPAGEKEPSHYTSQGGVAGGWGVVVVVEMVEEEAAEVVGELGLGASWRTGNPVRWRLIPGRSV